MLDELLLGNFVLLYVPASHVRFPPSLYDKFMEIWIEEWRWVNSVSFDDFEWLREEGRDCTWDTGCKQSDSVCLLSS